VLDHSASIHRVNRVIVSGWGIQANVILGLARACLPGRSPLLRVVLMAGLLAGAGGRRAFGAR
jgi:hypothetical protein